MSTKHVPHWQLPPGVARGTWDYAHSEHIAEDYDDYFAHNSLFELDQEVLLRHFTPPGVVADLGCGTGRALLPMVRHGLTGIAVDISPEMLRVVQEKADAESLDVQCVEANMVEMDQIATDSLDYAMCLFSTLGMIRGHVHRCAALQHVRRVVKPGGVFVLHVHNLWYNLYDPGGPWWLLGNLFRSTWDRRIERGDKFFEYRGIPNMYLHVFTAGELRRLLRRAGFDVFEWLPLDQTRHRLLPRPWLCPGLRANGWIIACR